MNRRPWLVLSLVLTVAACGVPDSGAFRPLPANDYPRALRVTIPPSVATTTTTIATTLQTPTSVAQVATEPIQLFYVQGDQVEAVSILEATPVSPATKLADLEQRNSMLAGGAHLATVLPADAAMTTKLERGVVTVELGSAIDTVLNQDQPLFFAQVVLTVLAPSEQGQVLFTQHGVPYPAVKADRTVLEPGVPVAWEDYSDLITGELTPPVVPPYNGGPPFKI
jgi:hypothetical protein